MSDSDLNEAVQVNSEGALVYTYNETDDNGYAIHAKLVLRQPVLCSYYDNSSSTNGPHFQDSCDTINLNRTSGAVAFTYLDNSSISQNIADNYHAKYNTTTKINEAGTYTFILKCDDSCTLTFDGQLRINLTSSTERGEVDSSFTVNLTANTYYPTFIEFDKYTGNSLLQLYWIRPGQSTEEIVPTDNLWFDHYYGGQRIELNVTCPNGYSTGYVQDELF